MQVSSITELSRISHSVLGTCLHSCLGLEIGTSTQTSLGLGTGTWVTGNMYYIRSYCNIIYLCAGYSWDLFALPFRLITTLRSRGRCCWLRSMLRILGFKWRWSMLLEQLTNTKDKYGLSVFDVRIYPSNACWRPQTAALSCP